MKTPFSRPGRSGATAHRIRSHRFAHRRRHRAWRRYPRRQDQHCIERLRGPPAGRERDGRRNRRRRVGLAGRHARQFFPLFPSAAAGMIPRLCRWRFDAGLPDRSGRRSRRHSRPCAVARYARRFPRRRGCRHCRLRQGGGVQGRRRLDPRRAARGRRRLCALRPRQGGGPTSAPPRPARVRPACRRLQPRLGLPRRQPCHARLRPRRLSVHPLPRARRGRAAGHPGRRRQCPHHPCRRRAST